MFVQDSTEVLCTYPPGENKARLPTSIKYYKTLSPLRPLFFLDSYSFIMRNYQWHLRNTKTFE